MQLIYLRWEYIIVCVCVFHCRVSFLGPYGVREYVASISPSHSASLAIGALQAVPSAGGAAGISRAVTVTMACDARVLDYELACRWLGEFKRVLESSAQGLQ